MPFSDQLVQILQVGLAGLVFLLAYFGFRLLAKEQKRENPRDAMLSHVCRFMWICVVLAILAGGVEVAERIWGSGPEIGELRRKKEDLAEKELTARLEVQTLQSELSACSSRVAKRDTSITNLEKEKEELEGKQLTVRQKMDLGLYYTQPVDTHGVDKRDSELAWEHLSYVLKNHAKELYEKQRREVVEGLIRIREKLKQEEHFEFVLRSIRDYIYGFEKELDLAKVYWAFANRGARKLETQRRAKSLEHFLRAASESPDSISDNDTVDIKTLIDILKKVKDKEGNYLYPYLNEHGTQILDAIRDTSKSEIERHLDEWLRSRETPSSFHFPGDRGKVKKLIHAAEGRPRETDRGVREFPPRSGIFTTIPEPTP